MKSNGRRVDTIPVWKLWWRKMKTFRAVAQKKGEGPISQSEFIERAAAIQRRAQQSAELREKTVSLWKLESMGFSLVRYAQPGNTLNDPRIPVEVRHIVHVGMGAGAVEKGRFTPSKIKEIIESYANPDYALFPYENLGAMLAVYESKIPLERMILGLTPLPRPEPGNFMSQFSPESQRLISHGYGRLIYFRNNSIAAAVKAAKQKPFLNLTASVQGMAFAFAMANNEDLQSVMEAGAGLPAELARAFRNGLTYALEFWEWISPGFLNTIKAESTRQSEIISAAQGEIAAARTRGYPLPFAVGQEDDRAGARRAPGA